MSATPEHGGLSEVVADLICRLRGLRENYAHRAEHIPGPPLSWSDARGDLDDVLAALDGLTWAQRRGLETAPEVANHVPPIARTAAPDPLRERIEALAAEIGALAAEKRGLHYLGVVTLRNRLRALLDDPAADGRAT